MPRKTKRAVRRSLFGRHPRLPTALVAVLVLVVAVGIATGLGPHTARARGEGAAAEVPGLPTAQETEELLESSEVGALQSGPETDPQAAEELPHRELDADEALELVEGVFGDVLEEPAGIYDELEPMKFLSEYAAIVPASSLPGSAAEEAAGPEAPEPRDAGADQPMLLESTLPLETEDAEGDMAPVDLGLESPTGAGGELKPTNPLTEVAIPARLEEGISVGAVGIEVVDTDGERTPAEVEEQYAFYPNVADNTDLVVVPTATGVETMTQIRSAEAPRTTTYRLSLPEGARLESAPGGGAEAGWGEEGSLVVPPPAATDAEGRGIPTEMEVEGDQLKVTVDPGPSTVYPILVDPTYETETWRWSEGNSPMGFAGWTGSSNTASYGALEHLNGYTVAYPGIDLTSGFPGPAYPGAEANWTYWVPRYSQDLREFGSPPTSWVSFLELEGEWFLNHGNNEAYPALVTGLVQPGVGWFTGAQAHYGSAGEFNTWGNNFGFWNSHEGSPQNKEVKGADMNLFTEVYEPQAKWRDTFVGAAKVIVGDDEAPKILELNPPSGWVKGASATIAYSFEDSGLGVQTAGVRTSPAEVEPKSGWRADYNCSGASASPCARVRRSSEAGAKVLPFVPSELPTGEDRLEVIVGDPLSMGLKEAAHVKTGSVTVHVDNEGPEVTLSGSLTEQGKLGIENAEYQLRASAKDGTEADPQSGVAALEIKVDGVKKASWSPGCKAGNCSLSQVWTMKASEYAAGAHEVEVVATDAIGNPTSEVVEVEFGQAPPQTSFTSPHPSHETQEVKAISFKATRGGAPVEGATFRCSLDGAAATACSSPENLPEHFKEGSHTFTVAAVDKAGKADPTPATWHFETNPYPPAPANEKLVFPEAGKKTASYYTLEAEWGANPEGKAGQGVTGVTFQMELRGGKVFKPVPTGCTVDGQGRPVSWPLPVHTHPGHSAPVYLKVRGCPMFEEAGYPEKEIQFRAVFDGGQAVTGASAPVTTEFVYRHNANRVSTDATDAVGPASVDLLTGAFTLSRTDVSIPVPGYEANLEFTRTYNSSIDESLPGYSKVLGGAWQPGSPLESEYEGESWTRVEEQVIPYHPAVYETYCWEEPIETVGEEEGEPIEEPVEHTISCPKKEECTFALCERFIVEEAQPEERWIELFDNEGASIPFEIHGEDYPSPEWAKELVLTKRGANFVLAYPNGTHTTFTPEGSHVWLPTFISYQANSNATRMVYHPEPEGKGMILVEEIAPAAVPCEEETARRTPGCRSLVFEYSWKPGAVLCYIGVVEPCQNRLLGISYYGPSGSESAGVKVAEYHFEKVADPKAENPEHERLMVLGAESDPRTGLSENYTYEEGSSRLSSLTPPGQTPWGFTYDNVSNAARLRSVSRGGATTTIAYEVPVKGSGAPYDMSPETIAAWGQSDLPVDATAIFPPNHAPSGSPPSSYTGATIHYIDPEGHEVNTASPSPPGVAGASITTSETDVKGNVVRELSARNRLIALESSESTAVSHQLDSHSIYNANGTEMLESWGPLHQIRLEGSAEVQARRHTKVSYDEGAPTPEPGTPPAYLPTKETVAAVVPGKEGEFEPRVTETKYKWKFRLPEETIIDPQGLHIRSVTIYNEAGQVKETRQPKGAGGETAGDTETVYYSAGGSGECAGSPQYANLPCKTFPVKQIAATSGRPELLVTKYLAYNALGEPTETLESPGGGTEHARKVITEYDAAGRQIASKVEGGGLSIPRTETLYSPTQGLPVRQQFACEGSCASYSSSFGTGGSGELRRPMVVAVDTKGNVYVVDRELNCVKEFSAAGTYLSAVGKCGAGGTGAGEFKEPRSVAIDPAGHIWVSDYGNARIEEFTAAGAYIQTLGGSGEAGGNHLSQPWGLAVDGQGRVVVGDNGKIVEFKEASPGVYPFAGEITAIEGSAVAPTGMSFDGSGNLWIAEAGANRISELEKTSSGLVGHLRFGAAGSGAGQFTEPTDVVAGQGGELLVVDRGNNRVQVFSPGGNYKGSFGTKGTGTGQFTEPTGVAVGPGGTIYVTDSGDHRVERWQVGSEATSTTYNSLGQVTRYEDADGAVTETTYDAYGRPATVSDPRGTETLHYDEASGVVNSMEVSGVGTFTASYDANGNLIGRGLPDGLTAATTYNQADEPMGLSYTKTGSCGESCTWYHESLERSIEGRILYDTSTLVEDHYSYDKDGRLVEAQETPAKNLPEEGRCTSREYKYDADSNRLSKVVRPGVGGACATSGNTPETYTYDEADRLEGPTYDAWGRITSLPAKLAGGNELKTTYFVDDMVASQTQGPVTNTFQLDATGRQRQREQAGGVAGIEIFHYDEAGDSSSWTSLGSTWSRNIVGIGGELAAVQESSGTTTYKLTDLHGDVVASASSDPTVTKLLATTRFTEFGEPVSGGGGRFGWLGGKMRRTELSSGVIQMGARSYIPQIGRFLTPDAVRGGSANAYDYANQDPVNEYDLEGTCAKKKKTCSASKSSVQVNSAARVRSTARVRSAARTRTSFPGYHPPSSPKPLPPYKPPHIPGNPKLPTSPPKHHCPPRLAKYTPDSMLNPCAPREGWEEIGPNVEFPWV